MKVLFLLKFPHRELQDIQPEAPLGEDLEPAMLSLGGKVSLRSFVSHRGPHLEGHREVGNVPQGGLIESFVAHGGNTKMSKKKIAYFSFENI